ncbi:TlpA family protein disulfide reductase [Sediminibacterium ginsengisoli]|uniref:TlpA family protein disulfide reductase n=1 Tax=Sediminibacterium ginsengisoli TaxID=413434 RepID=UPI0015902772|nr:TlpA disulfide reductase family protein [Sediminibacterium ginsengisoli]
MAVTGPVSVYTQEGINYVSGLIEPGDSLYFSYDANDFRNTLSINGKGAQKFDYVNSWRTLDIYRKLSQRAGLSRNQPYPFDNLLNFTDSIGTVFQTKLDSVKPFLSKESLRILQADLKANISANKYRSVGMVYHESREETLKKRTAELSPAATAAISNMLQFDESLAFSSSYINAVFNTLFMEYDARKMSGTSGKDLPSKYSYLDSVLPGALKTPVFTLFLENDLAKLNQAEDLEKLISTIYHSREDLAYREYISALFRDLHVFRKGMPAPSFTLTNTKGEKVTLSDFRGKVVLIDFWYEACGPCHALFENISSVKKQFGSDSVVFLCISVDSEPVWKESLQKRKIQGYHVFTQNQQIQHAVVKDYKVNGYPTTCLIDRNGNIFMATPSNNPVELAQQIRNALKQ